MKRYFWLQLYRVNKSINIKIGSLLLKSLYSHKIWINYVGRESTEAAYN